MVMAEAQEDNSIMKENFKRLLMSHSKSRMVKPNINTAGKCTPILLGGLLERIFTKYNKPYLKFMPMSEISDS